MDTCKDCLWCVKNDIGRRKYRCALCSNIKFNVPWLHGVMCSFWHISVQESKRREEEQEKKKNGKH